MDCKTLKCSTLTKDCRCYARIDASDQTMEQFCGYKENGYVIPCDAACCVGGCPGQCQGVSPKPPYEIDKNPIDIDKLPIYLKVLIFVILILLIVSTISA